MNRRVVVTGVGLICGCGIGTDEVWRNLLAGKSGIGPVTHFDPAGFDCRIAGEVRDFDPLQWVEKKELKKMARFMAEIAPQEFVDTQGFQGLVAKHPLYRGLAIAPSVVDVCVGHNLDTTPSQGRNDE